MSDVAGYALPRVSVKRDADGSLVCASLDVLEPGPATMVESLLHWADLTPDACFMAEREGEGWRAWTYREAADDSASLARRWLSHGLVPGRSVLVLASNAIAHARVVLAGQRAAMPVASANPRYAESAAGLARLKTILEILEPQAVALDDLAASSPACVALLELSGVRWLKMDGSIGPDHAPAPEVELPAIGPHTIARVFFTSGSTGTPKAVPYTQRMMTSNATMLLQVWPFLLRQPLVMLDWLPWSHGSAATTTSTSCCGLAARCTSTLARLQLRG